MSSLARLFRVSTMVGLLFVALVLLLVGCAPNAESALISPNLGPQLVLAHASGSVEIVPTAVPPKLAELTDDEIYAGLDPAVVEAIKSADVANSETIVLTYGCGGCHALDPAEVKTGPTWHNVGDTVVSRVAGESPALYLYLSITQPNVFVVPGYPPNIMPANFTESMTPEQIATMVAYLLAQNGQ